MNTRAEPQKRIGVVMSLLGLLVMLMPLTAFGSDHQVRICHATGSESNPYTNPLVPKHQIDEPDGHGSFVVGVHPDDIIPPFEAGSQGNNSWPAYPGKNWTAEGQVIWLDNCGLEDPETFDLELVKVWAGDDFDDSNLVVTLLIDDEAGPVEVVDGQEVEISETVTGLPANCTYESDAPESFTVDAEVAVDGLITLTITNTVDCEDTTTTTVAPTTTTTIPTQVQGTVITTSTTAPVVAVTTTIPDEVLDTAVEAEELPFTGIDSERLIGLAVLLMAGGLVVLGATGRREES